MRGFVIVCAAVSAAALSAPSARAVLVGADLREDKSFAGTPGLPADLRVVNLYILFNNNQFGDAVLSTLQLDDGFGIRKSDGLNQGATFFQSPSGGDLAPSASDIAMNPAVEFDTFVSIGQKVADDDVTMTDSTFSFTSDRVLGTWFNSNPPSRQGEAVFNSDTGYYETFIGQFAITGLDEGAVLNSSPHPGTPLNRADTLYGDVFSGTLRVFAQSKVEAHFIDLEFAPIPSPATGALAGVAGLALLRRRRN